MLPPESEADDLLIELKAEITATIERVMGKAGAEDSIWKGVATAKAGPGDDLVEEADFRQLAEAIYRSRRMRDRVFHTDSLFGEPAWDMLLDLAIAHWKGKRLPVTSLCIGSCVPNTTALRWIKVLTDAGLAGRGTDRGRSSRTFIALPPRGGGLMQEHLLESRKLQGRL